MRLYPYITPFSCVYTTKVNDIQGQRCQNRKFDRKLFPDIKRDTAGTIGIDLADFECSSRVSKFNLADFSAFLLGRFRLN